MVEFVLVFHHSRVVQPLLVQLVDCAVAVALLLGVTAQAEFRFESTFVLGCVVHLEEGFCLLQELMVHCLSLSSSGSLALLRLSAISQPRHLQLYLLILSLYYEAPFLGKVSSALLIVETAIARLVLALLFLLNN